MSKIIWLASYPKSGNTWLRIFLTNYLRPAATSADINRLVGGPIASARLWFDEWAGIEASLLRDAVIERLRPEVYRCLAREAQDTLYFKVHDAWTRTDHGEALFPADVTAGVIYILRNPLDMAMSCAQHWGVSIDQAVENLCNPDFTTARSLGGLSDQLRQRLGRWSDHVKSWIDESGLPVLLIRYEDMRRDPISVFGEVVRFCKLQLDHTRLKQAVAFSDFSEVQRQEQAQGFRERSAQATSPFFRRGQTGAWRAELPIELAQRIIATQSDTMRRFGYLTADLQPA